MSTSLKKNRLTNMVLDFVSLVPAGDNPEAFVVISKAAPSEEKDMADGDLISKEGLDPEVVTYIDGLEADNDTLAKAVEDLEAEKATLAEKVTEVEKALEDAEANGLIVKSEDEQRKALLAKADPAVRALLEKQDAEMAEVRKAAETERNLRLEREFIAKAEGMPMIAEDRTALGGLLRRISDALTPEDAAEVEKVLKAANEQIAKGNLFGEFGAAGGEVTISKSVEAAAQAILKAEPTLTHDQAVAKAYDQNPSLLAEAMTGQEA